MRRRMAAVDVVADEELQLSFVEVRPCARCLLQAQCLLLSAGPVPAACCELVRDALMCSLVAPVGAGVLWAICTLRLWFMCAFPPGPACLPACLLACLPKPAPLICAVQLCCESAAGLQQLHMDS